MNKFLQFSYCGSDCRSEIDVGKRKEEELAFP